MADLYDRLFPADTDAENIPVHGFFSAMVDYTKGVITEAEIITLFSLDAEAQSDLSNLTGRIDVLTTKEDKVLWLLEFHSIMLASDARINYLDKTSFTDRLNLV